MPQTHTADQHDPTASIDQHSISTNTQGRRLIQRVSLYPMAEFACSLSSSLRGRETSARECPGKKTLNTYGCPGLFFVDTVYGRRAEERLVLVGVGGVAVQLDVPGAA